MHYFCYAARRRGGGAGDGHVFLQTCAGSRASGVPPTPDALSAWLTAG